MPGPKFGTSQYLKAAEARWQSRRVELEYLLAELKAGRSLQVLAPLILNADIEKATLEETLGAGRGGEKMLREILKTMGDERPVERQTLEVVLEELTMCNAVFRVLRKRIREGEVFGPDEEPDARERKETVARWRRWRRRTDTRRVRGEKSENSETHGDNSD